MKISINHTQKQEFIATNESGVILDVGCCDRKTLFSPMELILVGLASCSSVDAVEIFDKKKIKIDHYSVDVNAERVNAVPAIFKTITLTYHIKANVDVKQLLHVLKLCVHKYCSVADILTPTSTLIALLKYNDTFYEIENTFENSLIKEL